MSTGMSMRVMVEGAHTVKVAESEGERARLAHEARCLRACAHPGVVALIGTGDGEPPGRLTLRTVPGGTLADAVVLPTEVLAGLGAALASTLADLHDLGWVHGAVDAGHVLLDEGGGPVLCGFGRAAGPGTRPATGPGADPAQDVAALSAMLWERLPAPADRRLSRVLASAGGGGRRRRPVGARELAARIVEAVPAARLAPPGAVPEPEESRPADDARDGQADTDCNTVPASRAAADGPGGLIRGCGRWRPSRRRMLVAGALACVAIAAATWPRAGSGPGARPAVLVPPAGVGPTGRYLLSGPAGRHLMSVVGRWGCDPDRPAVLDPTTGWVWVFGAWPAPGRTAAGRVVAHRPGATGLAVERAGEGCDALVVLGPAGRTYAVPPALTGSGR